MNYSNRILALGALAAALSASLAQAAPMATSLPEVSAQAPAADVLRAEVQATVARLIDAGAFGDVSPEQIAMQVDIPAERVVNVGVLVDSRSGAAQGLPVL